MAPSKASSRRLELLDDHGTVRVEPAHKSYDLRAQRCQSQVTPSSRRVLRESELGENAAELSDTATNEAFGGRTETPCWCLTVDRDILIFAGYARLGARRTGSLFPVPILYYLGRFGLMRRLR